MERDDAAAPLSLTVGELAGVVVREGLTGAHFEALLFTALATSLTHPSVVQHSRPWNLWRRVKLRGFVIRVPARFCSA